MLRVKQVINIRKTVAVILSFVMLFCTFCGKDFLSAVALQLPAQSLLGAAEFYDLNGSPVLSGNHFAKATLVANGLPVTDVAEGDLVTATVDYERFSGAYRFLGWYLENTLVNENEVFAFTATYGRQYTPRFSTGNCISSSASFEGYPVGKSLLVSDTSVAPENGLWGYCKNSGYDGAGSGATATIVDGAGLKSVMPNAAVPTGSKVLYMRMNYRAPFFGFAVQPNTEYILSFKWLTKSEKLDIGQQYYGIAKTYLSNTYNVTFPANCTIADAHVVALQTSDAKCDGSTWQTTTLRFNSGSNSELYMALAGVSDGNVSGAIEVALDDLICMPVLPATLAVDDMKSCASVIPKDCSLDRLYVGQTVHFSILHNRVTQPEVKLNGRELLPDKTGVYQFVATTAQNLSVRFTGDDSLNNYNADNAGNRLDAYNEALYLTPMWSGNTVYHETALFVTGRETVKLLYPVETIISVRSYDLKTNYVEDIDYEITADGLLKILPGSRIPVYTGELTTTAKPAINAFAVVGKENEWMAFIDDTVYPRYAMAVSYTHTTTFADGYQAEKPVSQSDKIKNTLAKLKAGENVNILVYGDSISCGWSSSGLNYPNSIYDDTNTEGSFKPYVIHVAPYAPTWIDMFTSRLSKLYPNAKIHIKNLSLGGKDARWGAANIEARMALWRDENNAVVKPDLILVGFGGNDVHSSTTPENFKLLSKQIVTTARSFSGNPNMEALYYSIVLPNQKAEIWQKSVLLAYESQLAEIAAEDSKAGLVDLTTISAAMVKCKEAVDYLNTNVSHGNDFTARLYATGLLTSFEKLPESPFTPGDVNDDGEKNLGDVVTLARVKAGWNSEHYLSIALDTNGDNHFDLMDVTYLAQNLAGYDNRPLSTVPFTGEQ